ncbi:hypothetical protein EC957_010909 [Mortierella hygrophila]|uniref:Uncharacterized protein n=1 Tax=Mortierella hygrophila TaxID=979708 RepID=A0A9P6K453_9FUNG|nr:hypothetical protein EC957_010909 [Mortierella hygrophila]
MKISLSIAALVLAVASVATAAPATVLGRAPSSNSTASGEGKEGAPSAPPGVVKILKQIGWLSSNYKSPESGSSPSSNTSHNGGAAMNSTHTLHKRAECNSLDFYWFRRHPANMTPDQQDWSAQNAFTLKVSPNKYQGEIPPDFTEGVYPSYREIRLSKDQQWRVAFDKNYKTGTVIMSAKKQDRVYYLPNFKHFVDEEDGHIIVTNYVWDCMIWT